MKLQIGRELITELDILISNYQVEDAREILKKIKIADTPMKYRRELGQLCRRVGLDHTALKFLQDLVYGAEKVQSEDTLEYVQILRKLGLINHALTLVDRIKDAPQSNLQKAFCYIATWNYVAAEEYLKVYCQLLDLEIPKLLVGRTNLISCLIQNEKLDEAEKLVNETKEIASKHSKHIHLNSLEQLGHIYLKRKQYDEAIDTLDKAYEMAQQQKGRALLFIDKWRWIAKISKDSNEDNKTKITDYLTLVREIGHWETLRDFQMNYAKLRGDSDVLDYVYFGTPFVCYRKTMGYQPLKDTFIWSQGKSDGKALDLFDAQLFDLPSGMGEHRLLMLLASDFFRPWTIERIFNFLYPEELFDPNSSSKKVYRLLEKLKKKMTDESGLEVLTTKRGYRLRAKAGVAILVHKKMQFASQAEFIHAYMATLPGFDNQYSAQSIMSLTGLSQSQAYKLLSKMKEEKLINSKKAA